REITIQTASAKKPYDGEALTNPGFYVSIGKLGEGHSVSLSVIGNTIEVGEVPNTINKESLCITDANGINVTRNYEVTFNLGTLTITP
ncbi:MAG: hypothetical protein J6Q57_00055, partial [Paraprevotella sp.]|nr:hypothetical protein [Paraprevotella sp.]